jgi:hypothetical protein
MSYQSSAIYRDAGCPSQCMSENDYYGLNGETAQSCPASCLSDYSSPEAGQNCPSVCNFQSLANYATLPGYYSAISIPATTASRIIPTPTIVQDFQTFNPTITSVNGNISSPEQAANIIQQAEAAKKEAFRYLRNRIY